jgi:hypothetical protein
MWSNQTEVATAAALEADAVAMEEEPEECTEHGGNAVPPFFPEKTQGFDHQQMRDLNIFSPENEGIYLDKTTCRILSI